MDSGIKERVLSESEYIIDSKDTIRATADVFGVSKSTVHVDVSKRLRKIDKSLYAKVKTILDENFNEKHIRGGDATRKKYLSKSLDAPETEVNK